MNTLCTKRHSAQRSLIFILCAVLIFWVFLPFHASAAKTLTKTVDLATIRQAARGEGYYWSNRDKTMTFTNLNMVTEDDYGFRFPSNATLILNGDNYISAKLVAIAGQDNLKIKGSGTLTLVSDVGIKMVSPELTSSLTFISGKITINAVSSGVLSEFPTVTLGNADLSIQVSDQTAGNAISAYSVMLNNGRLTANAPVVSANHLSCGGCDLTINASRSALVAKEITIGEGNAINVGESASSLTSAKEYKGEASISLVPTRSRKTSLILGDGYSVVWDYLILTLAVLLLAAFITLPILYKQRKDRIKRAQVEARRAAMLEEKKKAAKEARRAKYAGKKQSEE